MKTAAFRISMCAIAALCASALPRAASAGFLRIAFDDLFETGAGQDWTGSGDNDVPLSADGSSFASTFAGFALDSPPAAPVFATTPFADGLQVGSVSYDSFCLSKEGVLGLGIGAACSFTDATSSPLFSVLGGPWDYVDSETAFSPESISVALGLVDRNADGGDFERADAMAALRVTWLGMESGALEFQTIFYDMGGGDFDVAFNYSAEYSDGQQQITMPGGPGGAFTQLFFGLDDTRLTGLDTEPYFRFRDGVFSLSTDADPDPDPDPTPVPEPGTLWLLSAGAALLLLRRRATHRAR
jgi:hypothetical protein